MVTEICIVFDMWLGTLPQTISTSHKNDNNDPFKFVLSIGYLS